MKTCKKCGKEVANDVRFCTYCGEAFEQDTAKPQIVSPDEMEKKEAFRKIKQETEDMYSESRQTQEWINAENSYPKRKGKKRFVVVPVILALLALIVFGVDYFGPVKYIPRDFGDCLGRDIDYIQKKYQMSAYGDEDINDLLGVYVCGNAAVYDTDDDGTIDVISLGEISDENVLYSKDLYKIDGLKYGMSKEDAEDILEDDYWSDLGKYGKYYYYSCSWKLFRINYKNGEINSITLSINESEEFDESGDSGDSDDSGDFGDYLGEDIDYIQEKYQMSAYVMEGIGEISDTYVCAGITIYDTDSDGKIDAITLENNADGNSTEYYNIDGLKYGMSKKEAEEVLYDLYERDVELEDLSSDDVKYYWSPYSEKMYKITYKQNVIHDIFLYKR